MTTKKNEISKELTVFDVLNEMPISSVDLFWHQAGGRRIGKVKDNKAVIEVLVDIDTFQDFAFHLTNKHLGSSKGLKKFVMIAFDTEEYKRCQYKLLGKRKPDPSRLAPGNPKNITAKK